MNKWILALIAAVILLIIAFTAGWVDLALTVFLDYIEANQ